MKKQLSCIVSLFLAIVLQAQMSRTVTVATAGTLCSILTKVEKDSITSITVLGTIDARDFKTMRDSMPLLSVVDLRDVTIDAYNVAQNTGAYAQTIPPAAFNYKQTLTSVLLPKSIISIGGDAFMDCYSLNNVSFADPSLVTSIGSQAFKGCTGLTSIILPASITSINGSVFNGCTSLHTITIPSSTVSLGDYVFSGCTGLSVINFETPSSLINIGGGAFSGCTGLSSIIIPSPDTIIDDGAFSGCSNLDTLILPSSIRYIGNRILNDCGKITGLTIPSSVNNIGRNAFLFGSFPVVVDTNNLYFSSLDGVLFNKDKTVLIHCPTSKKGSYIVPPTVTTIKELAFRNCMELTSIELPLSLKTIGNSAFQYCTSITSISIPPSVTSFGEYVFDDCFKLRNVTIPGSVTEISQGLFSFCVSLSNVTIPSSVTSIGDYAFELCGDDNHNGLSTISIPASVTYIGKNAFQYCGDLRSVRVFSKSIIDLSYSPDVFVGVDTAKCVLYVPYGTRDAYMVADQWKDFKNIVEMPIISVDPLSVHFDEKAGSKTTDIYAFAHWIASSSESWLTVTPTSDTSESVTLELSVTANPTNIVRSAKVTILVTGDSTRTITVTQDAGTGTDATGISTDDISIYPNPASSRFSIHAREHSKVHVYSINGVLLLDCPVNNSGMISNIDLPTGLYIVKITTSNSTCTRRLIIEGK